jgi:two-component system, NtrC family, sensor kinase
MHQDKSSWAETHIDQLNADAWQVRVSDSSRALMLSEEAVRLGTEINYSKGIAEGLRTLGFSLIRVSKHREALRHLERSLELFELLNDKEGQSDVYEYLGIIQRSFGNYEASLDFLFKSLELRKPANYTEGESLSLYHIGVTYRYLGNYEKALDYFQKSLAVTQSKDFWISESYTLNNIGLIYFETGNYTNALEYFYQSLSIRRKSNDKWGEAGCLDNIGFCHFKTMQYKEAVDFCKQALEISESVNDQKGQGNSLFHLGNIYEHSGNYDAALNSYNRSLEIRREISDKKGEAEIILFLAELYANKDFTKNNPEEAFALMNDALHIGNEIKANDLLCKIHYGLYEIYKKNKQHEEALAQFEMYIKTENEVNNAAAKQKILNLEISHRVEKSRQEAEIYKLRNVELASLYEEVKNQKEKIEQTLSELKSTQAQLIQSEKMAGLGELMAGIAHEIQNPLNFVNNFSELNKELVDELQTELNAGDTGDAIAISNDIRKNEEKINHHGKRADAIVKNMLQHSRTSTGQKEPTDINALADEYLRLSYHGMRAKDKSFNVELKTDFDEHIGKIHIVPQDIGRVLLNLYNNAFYAVNEKAKQQTAGYEPIVSVITQKINNTIELTVKDYGNGIPQKVVGKIFQPFFTTKPTGEGTGLGLSLTYDIIKAHGGEIKVVTKEGEGSTFIILLPIV